MRDYDPMRHRELSGCAHSITETCDRCHCPTCGQPVVVATTGTTSVYVPLSAVEQAIDEGTQAALTPLVRGDRRPNANRD